MSLRYTINTEIKSKLNALEIDYLRSEGISGRESEIMRLGRKLMHSNTGKNRNKRFEIVWSFNENGTGEALPSCLNRFPGRENMRGMK